MRQKISAGFSAPLLLGSLAAVLAGCPTGIVETNAATPPAVTAVYAVDVSGGGDNGPLPSVALFLAIDQGAKSGVRVSAKAPASYGGVQVEFDQSLKGESVAQVETLNLQSSCTQSTSIQLVDSDAADAVIPSSVCYNPSTVIGSNPFVLVTAGSSMDAAKVFTCQKFSAKNALAPGHNYAVKITSGSIIGSNGKAVAALPTGGGWSGGSFKFATSDFEVLGTEYQDASTGYFHLLSKPAGLGFGKDLDAEGAAFRQPATSDTFFIVMSDVVNTDNNGNLLTATSKGPCDPTADPPDAACAAFAGTFCADLSSKAAPTNGECHLPASTVTRADGSAFPSSADNGSYGGDSRVIGVNPNGTWEPGVSYIVTISNDLQSADSGNALGGAAPTTFTFKTQAAPLAEISASPVANQTAVSATTSISIQYQAPIDIASATPANVKLTTGGADVPYTVSTSAGSNYQTLKIKPTTRLKPETAYSVSVSGLTGKSIPAETAGKTFAAYSNKFTTATFRISKLYNAAEDITDLPDFTDIDRSTTQSPSRVANGTLTVRFNNAATGVSSSSVHLLEVAPSGTTTEVAGTTVAPVVTDGVASKTDYTIKAPSTYAVKFGTRYQVKADTSITNPDSVALKAEGCSGGDCSDIRAFTTNKLAPAICIGTSACKATSKTTGTFTVTFNFGLDETSVNSQLPKGATDKAIKMFKKNADGSLGAAIAISCTDIAVGGKTTTCAPTAPIDGNATYLITVVLNKGSEAKVAAALGGISQDQTTGLFFGNRSATFLSSCP